MCPGLAGTDPDFTGCLSVLAIEKKLSKSPKLVGTWELWGPGGGVGVCARMCAYTPCCPTQPHFLESQNRERERVELEQM